jgi:hypothetical protein
MCKGIRSEYEVDGEIGSGTGKIKQENAFH